MKTSEFLGKARDILAKGWCQHEYGDGQGNVCAYGALYAADEQPVFSYGWSPYDSDLILSAAQVLRENITEYSGPFSIPVFNDNPATTKEDVLNVFDKAIIGLEETGN